jgi:hypothetical protein
VLVPVSILLAVGCARGPLSFDTEESSGESVGSSTAGASEDSSTDAPTDMAPGDGDGDPPGDGDGDGDGEPAGDGDGDGDSGPLCGNGAIDDGEQCDGNDLKGFRCIDLGYSSGTLLCDPVVCTFDTSMCEFIDPPGGGTTG